MDLNLEPKRRRASLAYWQSADYLQIPLAARPPHPSQPGALVAPRKFKVAKAGLRVAGCPAFGAVPLAEQVLSRLRDISLRAPCPFHFTLLPSSVRNLAMSRAGADECNQLRNVETCRGAASGWFQPVRRPDGFYATRGNVEMATVCRSYISTHLSSIGLSLRAIFVVVQYGRNLCHAEHCTLVILHCKSVIFKFLQESCA